MHLFQTWQMSTLCLPDAATKLRSTIIREACQYLALTPLALESWVLLNPDIVKARKWLSSKTTLTLSFWIKVEPVVIWLCISHKMCKINDCAIQSKSWKRNSIKPTWWSEFNRWQNNGTSQQNLNLKIHWSYLPCRITLLNSRDRNYSHVRRERSWCFGTHLHHAPLWTSSCSKQDFA